MSHTPGPWEWFEEIGMRPWALVHHKHPEGKPDWETWLKTEPDIVCEPRYWVPSTQEQEGGYAPAWLIGFDNRADMALIAAAPELLLVLQKLRKEIQGPWDDPVISEDLFNEIESVLKRATTEV